MNYDEVFKAINKGMPNYLSIELDKDVLLRECAEDKAKFLNALRRIREEYQNKIFEICGGSKAQYYFFDTFRIFTSYRNSETTIHISPVSFLSKLKTIMGVDDPSLDFNDTELSKKMIDRLEVLKKIKTPEELEKEFPIIYEDYLLSARAYERVKESYGNPQKYQELRRLYDVYGFDTRFDVFMQHQCRMYRNMIVRRQFVEGYTNRNKVELDNFDGLDKDKFELYLAYKYLEKANNSSELDEVQECVKYLAAYIREFRVEGKESISITVDDKKVTFRKILLGYSKLFRRFKGLVPLDADRERFTGYHINHVRNHINKYYGNTVNWFLVPNGNLEEYNDEERKAFLDTLKRNYNYLSKEERDARIKRRFEIYDRKVNFYESSHYAFKLVGLDSFNGYIAYVYNNGVVVLDKLFYDYTTSMPAYDEAIYIMDIDYFETLSKFDKTELRAEAAVSRKYHSGDWEGRIRGIISDNSTDASQKVLTLRSKYGRKGGDK